MQNELVLMATALSICLILTNKRNNLYNIIIIVISWDPFVDCSRKRPPIVSDQFLMKQEWSLTRELTVIYYNDHSRE